MRYPDFFIAGAPKCGTTALHAYLAQHPRIFMSYPKEPNYYCADLAPIRRTPTEAEYEKIFRSAPANAFAGEASPWYLYSREAAPLILKDNPAAKFIVCLRNPVDMFLSYHQQLKFNLDKVPASAQAAWQTQGSWPRSPPSPGGLRVDYAGICSLGEQVARLLRSVERSRVHFILFEDIGRNTRTIYEQTLAYLGIESDGRTEFPVHNWRKTHRFPALSEFLMRPPFPFNHVKKAVVKAVRLISNNPPSIYDQLLSKPEEKPSVDQGFRAELTAFFSEDVRRLEALIDRDLSVWK